MKIVNNSFILLSFTALLLSLLVQSFSGKVIAQSPETTKILSISGTVNFSQDSGKLSPTFSYNGEVFNDLRQGEYTVELLNRNNSVVLQQNFQPSVVVATNVPPKPNLYSKIVNFLCKVSFLRQILPCQPTDTVPERVGNFSFRLPYIDSVTAVRLKHNLKILDQLQPGTRSPDIKINPVETKKLPNAGEFKLTWSADEPDGDKVYYLTLLSTDNQKIWRVISSGVPHPRLSYDVSRMPKSDSIYFQVLASDGVNTSSDTIGPFNATVKNPTALIINPKDGDSIKQGWPIILLGSGDSPEEENTIPEERITWSSGISGFLGNGQTLQVEKTLPKGKHVITLSVMDKYGNKGSASVNLIIE